MPDPEFHPDTNPVISQPNLAGLTADARTDSSLSDESSGLTSFLLTSVIAPLIVVIAALVVYHHFFAIHNIRFGMVDVSGALTRSELVFTEMLTRPTTTDKERGDAYELVKGTGPKIEKSLADIQKQCDCVLLAKGAVIGQPLPDYTPQLYKELSIDSVKDDELRQKIAQYAAAKPAPTEISADSPLHRAYSAFMSKGAGK